MGQFCDSMSEANRERERLA